MAEVKVFDIDGKSKESRQLNGPLFNSEVKPHLLHEYAVGYLRNQRHGTASTKTRTMVRGGGRKPWRQKGTGRARAGTINSPLWVGGGVAWGPHPRDYYRDIPKKFRHAALKSAFSDKIANERIRIVDLPELDKPKSKIIAGLLKGHDLYNKRVLILYEGINKNLILSSQNIKWLAVKRSILVNPFDLIWADYILITPDAMQKIEEVFGK